MRRRCDIAKLAAAALLCLAVADPAQARRHARTFVNLEQFADVPLPPSRPWFVHLEADAPLPPPRPSEFAQAEQAPAIPLPPMRGVERAPASAEANAATPNNPDRPPAATPQDNEAMRAQVLASGKLVAQSLPPLAAPGACGIAAPVRFEAVLGSDGTKIAIKPPLVMRASLASVVADWVREDLMPVFTTKDDQLAEINSIGAYECRGRDHLFEAKLSEHATGNAMDIAEFVTAKGKHFAITSMNITDTTDSPAFLNALKGSACRRFMTVLGPGSDGFHAQHLHVDLEDRRSGAHLCQWNMPPTRVASPGHH